MFTGERHNDGRSRERVPSCEAHGRDMAHSRYTSASTRESLL